MSGIKMDKALCKRLQATGQLKLIMCVDCRNRKRCKLKKELESLKKGDQKNGK